MANNSWKILEKEKLLHTPVFDIYKEKAVLEKNNFSWNFFTIDCPHDWVTVVAVTAKKEIIFVKQFRFGTKKYELEVPGGLADKNGETPLEAGIRELREETGYTGNNARIIGKVNPNPALQGNSCYTILIEEAEKLHEKELDDAEEIETVLIPETNLKNEILKGRITHGLALNSLFFYELEKQKKLRKE